MPSAPDENPSLGDALYAALELSRPRLVFMGVFTAIVCAIPVLLTLTGEAETEATAEVDLAAFVPADTASFEIQSLTDSFVTTISSRSNLEATAEETDVDIDTLRANLSTAADDGATTVSVANVGEAADVTEEVALTAAQTALRDLATQQQSSARRDVDSATARVTAAEAALADFEAEVGVADVPGEYERLSGAVTDLTTQTLSGGGGDAALAATIAQRDALQPNVHRAESLEAEREDALAQLLDANRQVSQASGLTASADAPEVVRPGFATEQSKIAAAITTLASAAFVGILVSYAVSWFVMRRRKPDPTTS